MPISDRLTVGCLTSDTSYVNSTPWSAGNIVRLFGKLVLDKVRPRLGGGRLASSYIQCWPVERPRGQGLRASSPNRKCAHRVGERSQFGAAVPSDVAAVSIPRLRT
jgi:hypothetical protein